MIEDQVRELGKKWHKELYTLVDEREHNDDPELSIKAHLIFKFVRDLAKITGDWKEIEC
jgi:hypothetical protein